jgi:hypothetical protein
MTNLTLVNTQETQSIKPSNKTIQTLTVQQFFTKLSKFQGRQIEVDLSPIQASNTYHWFESKEINDSIEFNDLDNKTPQLLTFYKSDITDITYIEGENIFHSVFVIDLKDNQQIQLCVYEKPECCHVCHKVINLHFIENTWNVNATGGYGSHFDDQQISIKICDDCMFDIVNSQKDLH